MDKLTERDKRIAAFLHEMQTDPSAGLDNLKELVSPISSPGILAGSVGEIVFDRSAMPAQSAIRVWRVVLTLIEMLEDTAR